MKRSVLLLGVLLASASCLGSVGCGEQKEESVNETFKNHPVDDAGEGAQRSGKSSTNTSPANP